jgi:hypothetical protein
MRFKLESFPKDIIEKITSELSLTDIINLNRSHLSSNISKIFKTNDFWFHRFFNEFEFAVCQFSDLNYRAKSRYLYIHFKISNHAIQLVEDFLEVLGDFRENLKKGYKAKLYTHIYHRDIELLKHIVNNSRYIDDEDDFVTEFFEFNYLENFDDIFPIKMKKYNFWTDFLFESVEPFALSLAKYLRVVEYDEDECTCGSQ